MTGSPTAAREAIAAEVRAAAARKRMTQRAIARALGKSQQAMSRRWTGQLAFDVDELYEIAAMLDIAVTDLLPPPAAPAAKSGGSEPTVAKVTNRPHRSPDRRIRLIRLSPARPSQTERAA